MTATALLLAAPLASGRGESGLTLAQFSLSLAVLVFILAIAYFGGTALGEDVREAVSPAFRWRFP